MSQNRGLLHLTTVLIFVILLVSIDYVLGADLTGRVVDSDGRAVIAASVLVFRNNEYLTGTATDTLGYYSLHFCSDSGDSIHVTASSVGFETLSQTIEMANDPRTIIFQLTPEIQRIRSLRVKPLYDRNQASSKITHFDIERTSIHSLVPTNPVASIQHPQVTREGSSHSSKIRLHGTSPRYYINGIDIGYDPNHYGIFSIIPGVVIKKLQFYPQGTPVCFGLPSAIEFETYSRFEKHNTGEINLSSVEATGVVSFGDEDYFILASVRKSVLDKIVEGLNVKSERVTIPPTNFQDVFLSSGLKLNGNLRLILDQYYVRDFLSYTTDPGSINSSGIDTYQHTSESYAGLRLESLSQNLQYKIRGAVRTGSEIYSAHPAIDIKSGLRVDLKARQTTYLIDSEIGFLLGRTELTTGGNLKNSNPREIRLTQKNWNFLPPDAGSDNPYIYQSELNQAYDSYYSHRSDLSGAGFISVKHDFGLLEIESGLRGDYFRHLANSRYFTYRNSASVKIGTTSTLDFFHGTFADSPVNRILEPYQIIIDDNLERLKAVRTNLISVGISCGPARFNIFHKKISDLPMIDPNFSKVATDGTIEEDFFKMSSSATTEFSGGDISVDLPRFLSSRLDLYAFYGYTRAEKNLQNIAVPYELNSPHRFYLRLDYAMRRVVRLGGDMMVQSGRPYTPTAIGRNFDPDLRYTTDYYQKALTEENSDNFPTTMIFNLHADFEFGRTLLYLSISNVTNHENAIINSGDGYIYDAGILPGLGIKHSF
nr:TonB-dependent receptor [candidate division Zixibacteria bacterium]